MRGEDKLFENYSKKKIYIYNAVINTECEGLNPPFFNFITH